MPQLSLKSAKSGARFAPSTTRGLRSAAARPQTYDPATRTFEFVLASEKPCRTWRWGKGWDFVEVDEVLPMPGLEELASLRGAPILNSHSSWRLNDVIGVIEKAWIERDKLVWPENGPATVAVEIGVILSDGRRPDPVVVYGPSDYAIDDYAEGDALGIDYVIDGDPVRRPIDVARLRQPEYSILSMRVANDAWRQFAAARVLASNRQDIRRAPQVCPSYAVMSMRSLAPSETLRREVDVVGALMAVPGGTGGFI